MHHIRQDVAILCLKYNTTTMVATKPVSGRLLYTGISKYSSTYTCTRIIHGVALAELQVDAFSTITGNVVQSKTTGVARTDVGRRFSCALPVIFGVTVPV